MHPVGLIQFSILFVNKSPDEPLSSVVEFLNAILLCVEILKRMELINLDFFTYADLSDFKIHKPYPGMVTFKIYIIPK